MQSEVRLAAAGVLACFSYTKDIEKEAFVSTINTIVDDIRSKLQPADAVLDTCAALQHAGSSTNSSPLEARYVAQHDAAFALVASTNSPGAPTVSLDACLARCEALVELLQGEQVARVFLIASSEQADAQGLPDLLAQASIQVELFAAPPFTDASDYMSGDEEDLGEVEERLRQLGYL